MSLLRKHLPWSLAESSSHEELLTASSFESIGQNKKASPEAKPLEKSKMIGFVSRLRARSPPRLWHATGMSFTTAPASNPSDRTKKQAQRQNLWACFFGLPDRIRTYGLQSRSLSLYPAGLRVDIAHRVLYHFIMHLSSGFRRALSLYFSVFLSFCLAHTHEK